MIAHGSPHPFAFLFPPPRLHTTRRSPGYKRQTENLDTPLALERLPQAAVVRALEPLQILFDQIEAEDA